MAKTFSLLSLVTGPLEPPCHAASLAGALQLAVVPGNNDGFAVATPHVSAA